MPHVLLHLVLIFGHVFRVTDHSGLPVQGASVLTGDSLIAVTDALGNADIDTDSDTLEIRAAGYASWTGILPPSRVVLLEQVTVQSGAVVTVRAPRGIFRNRVFSTTALQREDMEFLGRAGFSSLGRLSGGVHAREYGGALPVLSVSLRGADAAHTGYFVDGHAVGSSLDGLPGTFLEPLLFGGMELAKGGGAGYAGGGAAGSLNFLPESPAAPSRASVSAGDDGSAVMSGAVTTAAGRLALGLRRSKGVSGTTGYRSALLLSGGRYPYSYGLLGSFSSGGTESPDWSLPADGHRKRAAIDCWGRRRFGRLSYSAGVRVGTQTYRSTVPFEVRDTHDEASGYFTAEFGGSLRSLDVRASATAAMEGVRSTAIGVRDRKRLETALEVFRPGTPSVRASGRLCAVPGMNTGFGSELSLSIPVRDSLLVAHVSGSTGLRHPALNDLYWPEDNFARGNPDLRPEFSAAMEAGLSTGRSGPLEISVTAFAGTTRDMIRWEPGADGKWTPVNISSALRRGLETEAGLSAGPLRASGTLSIISVTDRTEGSVNFGRALPYIPDHTWSLRAVLHVSSGIRVSAAAGGTGLRFTNYSETSWIPAYTILSAGIAAGPLPGGRFSLNVNADNLLNEEYHETGGYSGRPRTISVGIEWKGS